MALARATGGREKHAAVTDLPPEVLSGLGPPVGGTFQFQIFIQAPSPEIWRKTIFGGEEVAGAVSGVGCFWATSDDRRSKREWQRGCHTRQFKSEPG